ncbi:MAG: L,D-transpeptidase [Labilithrix sp.]|nr:L,D-transpeptidase [Labilithrix sp.]
MREHASRRRARWGVSTAGLAALAIASVLARPVRAEDALPPWTDRGDVPLPSWARSVTPNKPESAIYAEPGKLELRRGSAQPGARLPLYATRRAGGCMGRWLNVGPLAWMCSDVADFSEDAPWSPALGTRPWVAIGGEGTPVEDLARPSRPGAQTKLLPVEPLSATDDGLPYRYYFAGRDGAFGFANLASALDDAPDQELEPGFAVAILEEKTAHGERWGRTKKGRWVAMRELGPARANLFHGELLDDASAAEPKLDVAWVVSDKANVFGSEKADKVSGTRVRFEKVRVFDEKPGQGGGLVRVSADKDPAAWMRARDLSRPRLAAPPPEIGAGDVAGTERWIDVDLASQTLVAYAGKRPVFATLVSTGKGPPGSEFATRTGTFRIWVKVFTTKMDNLDKEDVDRHYAIEDVPWVQFFDKAIALHGAFWHRDFGHVHSHGCVNLAPLDARWLFAFTGPHLPAGWTAALPTKIERGTVVRVR